MRVYSGGSLVDNLVIGGRTYTDVSSNLIILVAAVTNGSGPRSGFRVGNVATQYQVPAGKTLRVTSIKAIATAGAIQIKLAHTTADPGFNTGGSFTGTVWYLGVNPAYIGSASGVGDSNEYNVNWTIPQNLWPAVDFTTGTSDGTLIAYGYLE